MRASVLSARLVLGLAGFAPGAALAVADPAAARPAFEEWSDGATLRLDYHHGGLGKEETFALDGLRREGDWPGSRVNLVDPLGLGAYRFEVRDRATQRVLFARGFSSIYGEWETTAEPATVRRSFHESLRFPFPRRPVQVGVQKRGHGNLFTEVAAFPVDPASGAIRREPVTGYGTVWTLFENGPPAEKVDLLILGDGYTQAEMERFHDDARRLSGALFATAPFSDRLGDFNVRAIDRASEDSGVDRPSDGVHRRTALGMTYDIFDALARRMALALGAAGRAAPPYLEVAAWEGDTAHHATAAFAQPCFWSGEAELGRIPGVISTEAGWLEGREVTLVRYHTALVTLDRLLEQAVAARAADKVYLPDEKDRLRLRRAGGVEVGALDGSYRRAGDADQKRHIRGSVLGRLDLSPMQLTKVNALLPVDPDRALAWLTPRQRREHDRLAAPRSP